MKIKETVKHSLAVGIVLASLAQPLIGDPYREYEKIYFTEVAHGQSKQAMDGYKKFIARYDGSNEYQAIVQEAKERVRDLEESWPVLNDSNLTVYMNFSTAPDYLADWILDTVMTVSETTPADQDYLNKLIELGAFSRAEFLNSELLSTSFIEAQDIYSILDSRLEESEDEIDVTLSSSDLTVFLFRDEFSSEQMEILEDYARTYSLHPEFSMLPDRAKKRLLLGSNVEPLETYAETSAIRPKPSLLKSVIEAPDTVAFMEIKPSTNLAEFTRDLIQRPFEPGTVAGEFSDELVLLRADLEKLGPFLDLIGFHQMTLLFRNREEGSMEFLLEVEYPSAQHAAMLASIVQPVLRLTMTENSPGIVPILKTDEGRFLLEMNLPETQVKSFLEFLKTEMQDRGRD